MGETCNRAEPYKHSRVVKDKLKLPMQEQRIGLSACSPFSCSILLLMYPPSSASIGVAAIESATVVSSSLQRARSIRPLRSAMPSATNANSPSAVAVCNREVLRGWREGKGKLFEEARSVEFSLPPCARSKPLS